QPLRAGHRCVEHSLCCSTRLPQKCGQTQASAPTPLLPVDRSQAPDLIPPDYRKPSRCRAELMLPCNDRAPEPSGPSPAHFQTVPGRDRIRLVQSARPPALSGWRRTLKSLLRLFLIRSRELSPVVTAPTQNLPTDREP